MWTRALVRTVALIALSVFVGGERLLAQDVEAERPNRPATVRAEVTRAEPAVVKPPTELGCARKMNSAYAAVLTYLNSTAQPSRNELHKAAQDASGIESQDLSVIALGSESTPDFLVGCSCNVDVTNVHATFRVFKAVDRGYLSATKSEDYPILAATGGDASRIDNASLEVALLAASDSQTRPGYFVTTWTRGGGRPAPFSVIAWEWDGQMLQPVWSKLEIRGGTVSVLGPVIVLSGVGPADPIDADVSQPDVFRISEGTAVYDGKLSGSLLKKYAAEKIITPQSPAEFSNLATLWQSAGDVGQAITLYERAITASKDGEANYLYLTVADLYQGRGELKNAAKALQSYQKASKAQLSIQSKQELSERIRSLQTSNEQ
jgi:tetratricopeptide (TPR) repeat protein